MERIFQNRENGGKKEVIVGKKKGEVCKDMEKDKILVNASKLGQGLKTTFMGMAMIFDSFGAEDTAAEIRGLAVKDGKKRIEEQKPKSETNQDQEEEAEKQKKEDFSSSENEVGEETAGAGTAQGLPDSDRGNPSGEVNTGQAAVTADDITKVIVAKIKQKRSNNAKIGQLLKTYGVEKVSSLPVEKYEAFLTDISQL